MAEEQPSQESSEKGALIRAFTRTWENLPRSRAEVAGLGARAATTVATTTGLAELSGLSARDTIVAGTIAAFAASKVRGETNEFLDNYDQERGESPRDPDNKTPIRLPHDPAEEREPLKNRVRDGVRGLFDLPTEEQRAARADAPPNLLSRVGSRAYQEAHNIAAAGTVFVATSMTDAVMDSPGTAATTSLVLANGYAAGKLVGRRTEQHVEERVSADMDNARAAAFDVTNELAKGLDAERQTTHGPARDAAQERGPRER